MVRTRRKVLAAIALVAGIGFSARISEDPVDFGAVPTPAVAPSFRISKLRSKVHLRGHTISLRQEQVLLRRANEALPGLTIEFKFEPLGLLPTHWERTTSEVLMAIASTESGSAIINTERVVLDAVVSDSDAWQTQLQTLRSGLPDNVTVVDDTIVARRIDTVEQCRRAFDEYEVGAINFEESTAEFRDSAYPHLDRLAAISDACREVTIRITGHTDSSGSEDRNRRLSRRRAEAVAGYLVTRGIAANRLESIGAGSADPLATNESRYGRSLNRRIEIEFVAN